MLRCVEMSQKDTNRLDTNYDSFHIHRNIWHCHWLNTICRMTNHHAITQSVYTWFTICVKCGIVFIETCKMPEMLNQVTEHQY